MARKTSGRGKKEPTDFSYLLIKENKEITNEDTNNDEKENEE